MNNLPKKPVELVERTGREIFKFDAPGQVLRGRLISIDNTEINSKPAVRYTLNDEEEGKFYSFLGTIDLNTKIRPSDLGKVVHICYEGQDPRVRTERNP